MPPIFPFHRFVRPGAHENRREGDGLCPPKPMERIGGWGVRSQASRPGLNYRRTPPGALRANAGSRREAEWIGLDTSRQRREYSTKMVVPLRAVGS